MVKALLVGADGGLGKAFVDGLKAASWTVTAVGRYDLDVSLRNDVFDLVRADKPEVVGQIMTRSVRVASADRHIVELVPLFSEGGHHHVPIIDEAQRLVGIITQSDLVRALYRAARPSH